MRREKVQNEYMFDTKVENIFINEYMVSAPENFVKIYLVALMYTDLGKEPSDGDIAKNLGIEEEEVKRAWKYWTELNVVKQEKGEIVFLQLKEQLYGQSEPEQNAVSESSEGALHILDNSKLKEMFSDIEKTLARPLGGGETEKILDWIDVLGATPEVITCAYNHCVSNKKESVNYIGKVVESWTGEGFKTASQVKKHLEGIDQRRYTHSRIMQALGFPRMATEEERRIIDRWIDDFNFSMDTILEACSKTSGISNPNINYVNKVLINKNKEKTGKDENGKISRKHILDYYSFIREKAEEEANIRKEEIFDGIPEIEELSERKKTNYMSLAKLAVAGGADKQEKLRKIKKDNENIENKIKRLLTENGIPVDYMDIHYKCPLCKDTGTLEDGRQCSCYASRAKEAEQWEKA